MYKVAYGLLSGEYSQKKLAQKVATEEKPVSEQPDEFYQDGIRPQIFKNFFGKDHPDFKTGQQQDAREYLSHLLDKMHKFETQAHTGQNPSDLFAFE